MSVNALLSVMRLTAPSAAAKLVLLCLADSADERGQCAPTIQQLAFNTQLPEKAVRENLRLLIGANLLREDAGTTSSKRVYTLLPEKNNDH
jgi:hypothetical protein